MAMIEQSSVAVVLMLILAHLAGDFVLQSDGMVAAKQAGRLRPHVAHMIVHAALAYICAGLWTLWVLPFVIGLTHGMIDSIKEAAVRGIEARAGEMSRFRRAIVFLTDQVLHLIIIVTATVWLIDPAASPAWIDWFGPDATGAAILLMGLIITTWGGAGAVGFGTEPYLAYLKAEVRRERGASTASAATSPGSAAGSDSAPVRRGFPKGGRTIGLLERALVFLFVITGNMTGVGFLVAAKSVFRFGEIKEPTQRKEAEYILIGTLMSFTWAIFTARLTRWPIDLVAMA